jgi:natural product precursor
MKKLGKLTIASISEDKLKNQEMRQIFGGIDSEENCLNPSNPSTCRSYGSSCTKMVDGVLRTGQCNAETSTHCYCIVSYV